MDKQSKIVQEWLKFSRQDLRAAQALYALNDETMYRNIGFLCQQTAEKSIKAFLATNKVKFGKIHDLQLLGAEIVKINSSLSPLMLNAIRLTPYAVEFRYPESADKPITKNQIDQALALAEQIQRTLLELI